MLLVGRQRHSERLERAIERTAPGLVVVTGVAGVGKSTLLQAVVAGSSRRVAVGRGLGLVDWKAYLAVSTAIGRPLTGEPHNVAADLDRHLGDRLLVIDDAHLCDPSTLDAIEELASLRRACVAVRAGTAAERRLSALAADRDRVVVEPLSDDDAHLLVSELRPGLPVGERHRLAAAAQGIPLLLHFALSVDADADLGRRVGAELARLSAAARRVLGWLVVGAPSPDTLDEARDELVAAGFVNDEYLVHESIASALLESFDGAELTSVRSEVARTSVDPSRRARCLAAIGRQADAHSEALTAASAATSVYERAQHLVFAASLDPADVSTAVDAAHAAASAGQYGDVVALLERRIEQLDTTSLLLLARAAWSIGRYEVTVSAASRADEVTNGSDPAVTAALLAIRARVKGRVEWDGDGALRLAHQAAGLAEAHGLDLPEIDGALATASLVAGTDHWRRALERSMAASGRSGDRWALAVATDTLFFAELLRGEPARCADVAERGLAITRDIGSALFEAHMRKNLALARFHVDGAGAWIVDELGELSRKPLHPRTRDHVDAHLALALSDTGRDADAQQILERSPSWDSDDSTTQAMIRWAAAEVHWAGGRWEEAITVADECRSVLAFGFPAGDLVVPIRQWACCDLGRDPGPALPGVGFPNVEGARLESEAISALAAGRLEDACAGFLRAAQRWSAVSRRNEYRCLWAASLAAAESGDRSRARELIEAVAPTLQRDGREPLRARVERVARRVGAPRTRRPATARVGPFTAAEADMLRLVAQGLDSVRISRRLQVSRDTVDSTITRATQKIGARRRVDAAAHLVALERRTGTDTPRQRLLVVADQVMAVSVASFLDADRIGIEDIDRLRFDLSEPPSVLVCSPETPGQADLVALAAARGAHVVVWDLDHLAPTTRDLLLDQLARIGHLEHVDRADVDVDVTVALRLLGDGLTVERAARQLGLSPRTLYRRLADARAASGVTTNKALTARAVRAV